MLTNRAVLGDEIMTCMKLLGAKTVSDLNPRMVSGLVFRLSAHIVEMHSDSALFTT